MLDTRSTARFKRAVPPPSAWSFLIPSFRLVPTAKAWAKEGIALASSGNWPGNKPASGAA